MLVTTLTKKMAEDLTDYLIEIGRAGPLPALATSTRIERIEILRDLRLGEFDVLVGINLLREGLDLPEVSLVAILDADKEGFLRSETSLIQTIGRAARNVDGRVIMYADKITDSMRERDLGDRTAARTSSAYNIEHDIDPQTVRKKVTDILEIVRGRATAARTPRRRGAVGAAAAASRPAPRCSTSPGSRPDDLGKLIQTLRTRCTTRPKDLRFEEAARLRDEITELRRELARRRVAPRTGPPTRSNVRSTPSLDRYAEAVAAEPTSTSLTIQGAREHNLKDVSLRLPRERLIVFTGLSGSGKSSLAFDTIYAEGQRRYVESLSAYARQFLGQMDKPDVDFIEGLSPAISIDQKSAARNPRSTVGTITEIYDYLRLLYARVGVPHCPKCGRVITRQTPQQIVDRVLELAEGTRFQVLAPVVRGRKGEYDALLKELAAEGFTRARVDGELVELGATVGVAARPVRAAHHRGGRRPARAACRHRAAPHRLARDGAATRRGCRRGRGRARDDQPDDQAETLTFSEHLACSHCGLSFDELAPRNFSFNSPYGA